MGVSVQFSKRAPYRPAIAQLRRHELDATTEQPEARQQCCRDARHFIPQQPAGARRWLCGPLLGPPR